MPQGQGRAGGRGRDSPWRKCLPAMIRAWGSLRAQRWGQCPWSGAASGRPELGGLWRERGPCPRWALRSGREPGSGPGQPLGPVQAAARPRPACPPRAVGSPLASPCPQPRPWLPGPPTRWPAFLLFPLNKTGRSRYGSRTSGPATQPCDSGQGHPGPRSSEPRLLQRLPGWPAEGFGQRSRRGRPCLSWRNCKN